MVQNYEVLHQESLWKELAARDLDAALNFSLPCGEKSEGLVISRIRVGLGGQFVTEISHRRSPGSFNFFHHRDGQLRSPSARTRRANERKILSRPFHQFTLVGLGLFQFSHLAGGASFYCLGNLLGTAVLPKKATIFTSSRGVSATMSS